MAKFRKKPVVIDAVQLTWQNWDEVCDFIPRPWFERGVWLDKEGNQMPDGQYRFEDNGHENEALGLLINTS